MSPAIRPKPIDRPAPPLPQRQVLVLDGDADRRAELVSMLAKGGYRGIEASTCAEALTLCDQLSPDMILSDWHVPDMAAPDFCRAFRALVRDNYGYLVLLISDADARTVAQGLQAGADDFLTRPVQAQQLLIRMAAGERILRIEQELRASNRQLQQALTQLSEAQAAMENDLQEARKLQQGLVRERSGRFGMLDISLLLRPAGHIGGDLVGFFPISEERVGFYALDVSGHGVTAALLTAQLSVHLSHSCDQNIVLRGAQAGSDEVGPAALAHFFNTMLLEEMNTDTYFTMLYAELNHMTGHLRMVQAGHPHPVLQRADGSILHLGKGGMPIGVFEDPLFDQIDIHLHPGDRLLVASDGITEATTPSGLQLGDDGLEAVMRTNAFLHGHSFLESMAWSVSEYCRGERQDDISAVLIEYRPDADVIPLTDPD